MVVEKQKHYLLNRYRNRARKKLFPSSYYSNNYRRADFFAELKVLYLQRKNRHPLVHAIYAEDQLNVLLSHRKWLNAALVGSFHLPESSKFMRRLSSGAFIDKYKQLDAAIVMSREMVPFIESLVGEGKVFWVPHGIRTDLFKPSEERLNDTMTQNLRVLTVGNHGRDWNTYKKVVKEAQKKALPVEFIAVVPSRIRTELESFPGVKTYAGIPESELILLNQSADILYMPLEFSTANNSILEAMACGVPVLSNNIGGVPDYVDPSSSWMVPEGDVTETISLLKRAADDRSRLLKMRKAARNRSLQFDWKVVAGQVKEVYDVAISASKKKRG
jgi:glycosyltransferase involved in cell wall biosynthesis